ncbi:DUF6886 family protein [Paenibacillus sp. NPDC093718]|uniref:DUF6886 family protein n=1 Tax=Paenibacillus sp. NPDC093718 TaxID=3390601 RepID=UPI003CFDC659
MLFHFSEEADIEIFIPREKQNRPDFPAVVWAIDAEHEFSYYFWAGLPNELMPMPLKENCNEYDHIN